MLQVARLARQQLHDSADLVVDFILSQMAPEGGFCDRQGKSDLYYTVFGLEGLRALSAEVPADRGYANLPRAQSGVTPATAAALSLFRQIGDFPPPEAGDWLLNRCHPQGGFFASPQSPIPDLLSTATALHALSGVHRSLDSIK